jgi:diguanylate cyclase (GGDEF)-like protein
MAPPPELVAGDDVLAGLATRVDFEASLDDAVEQARHDGGAVAVLSIDLNGFKRVNDSLGRCRGDGLLRDIAGRLQAAVRQGETLGRIGGDEFAVLVRGLEGTGGAADIAWAIGQRLADALRAPFEIGDGVEILVGAAIGVSLLPGDAEDAEALIKHADAAMYEAKVSGAAVLVHSSSTPDPLERLALAARLRRAIDRDQLVLHYQPIVRLPSERIMGVEALVRWQDPERGLVGPDQFIGVAESTGIIEALGDWVFDSLCRQAAIWQARGLAPNFGYNVSERQLRRPGLAAALAARAGAHGIPPGRFILELTETAWSVEADVMANGLGELRAAGFGLAIDDFGAGYSSLQRLLEHDVQVIKVDRAFLRAVPADPRATAVLDAMTQLAVACGCDVVAEGVETVEQRDFLVSRGCRLAQGYHFARPAPAAAIESLLAGQLVSDRRGASA